MKLKGLLEYFKENPDLADEITYEEFIKQTNNIFGYTNEDEIDKLYEEVKKQLEK